MLVPVKAVKESMRGTTHEVFIVMGDTAYRKAVETGRKSGDFIEIRSGLKKGDIVAVGNVDLLSDRMRVRVNNGKN